MSGIIEFIWMSRKFPFIIFGTTLAQLIYLRVTFQTDRKKNILHFACPFQLLTFFLKEPPKIEVFYDNNATDRNSAYIDCLG